MTMRRLALFATFFLITALSLPGAALAADRAAAWSDFKAAFSEAASLAKTDPTAAVSEIDKAGRIFDAEIGGAVEGRASAKAVVLETISSAREAAADGDVLKVQLMGELAQKSSVGLFLGTFEARLKAGDVDGAREWFDVLAAQLKYEAGSDIFNKMKALEANPKLVKTEGNNLVNIFVVKIADKIAEEVDEAIVFADPKSPERDLNEAQIKAAEGVGFFNAGEDKLVEKLGFEDTARLSGLLDKIYAAVVDGDFKTAKAAAEVVKDELAEIETTKKISGSALVQKISHIEAGLTAAGKSIEAGKTAGAKKLIDEAWTDFTRIESQIRGIDAASYVGIEKLFGKIKDSPKIADVDELKTLFADVSAISSGEKAASRASTTELIFTSFERIQPILFTFLALLGVYPIYLITRAFGWRHKAWRNIGIFIMLLILPVFMEAAGRLGVEMKIEVLQALSFTVSEWAKMAWTLIILAAFLFAINGLRAFCAQFGIRAIGVRIEEEAPAAHVEEQQPAEVL